MTEQDLTILNKMQALMEAADAQASRYSGLAEYRFQCFAMIEPYFWALADQLSFRRYYDYQGTGYEAHMSAFMLAHDPVTCKWFTDTLEQLGLQEHAPSTEDTTNG